MDRQPISGRDLNKTRVDGTEEGTTVSGRRAVGGAEGWTHLDRSILGVHSRCFLTSGGGVPECGGGLGESLVYNRVHVFGKVDR